MNERALEVLGDYLYELETNDRRRGVTYGTQRTRVSREREAEVFKPLSQFDQAAQYAATLWEKEQFQVWKQQGRITEDGFLRVGTQPVRPYTLPDIMRIMPHLGVFDRLAVLIDLDGEVEEGFMDAHENIKAVVKDIAADEVERVLQTDAAKARIADIVHEQIGVVFGTLRESLKGGSSTLRPGGRQLKCGKCGTPGHRAPTCTKTPDEIAALQKQREEASQS